jgi:hypothetical protein
MIPRSVRTVLVAIILTAFFGSCTPDGGSIFFILENEKKQPPSNLGNTISVEDVAYLAASDRYYAASGKIFYGTVGAGAVTWNNADSLEPPETGALCNALVAFQGTSPSMKLFGGFFTSSSSGLYAAGGTNGDDFTVAGSKIAVITEQVVRLIVADNGNTLLVVTAAPNPTPDPDPYLYSLYASTDGAAYTACITALTKKINDASYDGASYYAVSGNKLYNGAAGAMTGTTALGSTIAADDLLNGVYALAANNVYVSSKSSGIHHFNGTTWSGVAPLSEGGKKVSYLGISGPVTGGASQVILIGSEGYGYYYLNGTTLARTADDTIKTLGLYNAVVHRIAVFPLQNLAFACTSGGGLWQGDLSSDNSSGVTGWEIK